MRLEELHGHLGPPVAIHIQSRIADEQPLEVDLASLNQGILVEYYEVGQLRDVDSCVGLARNPEGIGLVLGELLEPEPETLEVVVGRLAVAVLVRWVVVDGKSYSRGTLDVEDVGLPVPGEGVGGGREGVGSLVDHMWPELLQET